VEEEFIKFGDTIFEELNQYVGDEVDEAKARIKQEEARIKQEKAIQQAIDLNSYRLDAWITSLATRRLEEQRKITPTGIYFGAYGVVEHLRRDVDAQVSGSEGKYEDKSTIHDGGIIHCPTPAQSMTATIFKNSFMSNQGESEDANPYTLNLTSDRLQHAQKLMQGMREDQEIEALLGYQLERYLHDDLKDELIYTLREHFAFDVEVNQSDENAEKVGFKRLSVINGLALFRAFKAIEDLPALTQQIEEIKAKITNVRTPKKEREILQKKVDQLLKEEKETKALEDTTKAYHTKVEPYIKKLENLLDGNLDTLFFEAGYQLFNGNISQSAAAMDAAKGKLAPPVPEAIKTRIPGKGINHELVLLFPEPDDTDKIKAALEPRIEAWLAEQLGDLENMVCEVELYDKETNIEAADPIYTKYVSFAQLGLSLSDLMYLSDQSLSDGSSELELLIWKQVKVDDEIEGIPITDLKYLITPNARTDERPLSDVLEVLQYALQVLGKSGNIKADSLLMEGIDENAAIASFIKELKAIKERVFESKEVLKGLKGQPDKNKKELAQFNLAAAKYAFLTDTLVNQENFTAEVTAMLSLVEGLLTDFEAIIEKLNLENYTTLFDLLAQASKALMGPAFIVLQPSIIGAAQKNQLSASQQTTFIGGDTKWGQRRIQTWVQGVAQVQQEVEVFEDWQMVKKAWKGKENNTYKIIQNYDENAWTALSEAEMSDKSLSVGYANGSKSLVVYGDISGATETKVVYGLSVVSFPEHIPDKEVTTGLSFHYNAPNNEPPQALLLAVSPNTGDNTNWQAIDLAEIIADTIDLAKIRMIDPELVKEKYYPILPMTNWFHIPTVN